MHRRMLGDVFSPECTALRELIQTQSKQTLAAWATAYAKAHYLPVYEAQRPQDTRLRAGVIRTEECLSGKLKPAEIKPDLKALRELGATLAAEPVAQAAARAVSAACATVSTPTNALGFLFYGAAAVAYNAVGLAKSPETYDELATQELERALASLAQVAVPDEKKPAKIDWHC